VTLSSLPFYFFFHIKKKLYNWESKSKQFNNLTNSHCTYIEMPEQC